MISEDDTTAPNLELSRDQSSTKYYMGKPLYNKIENPTLNIPELSRDQSSTKFYKEKPFYNENEFQETPTIQYKEIEFNDEISVNVISNLLDFILKSKFYPYDDIEPYLEEREIPKLTKIDIVEKTEKIYQFLTEKSFINYRYETLVKFKTYRILRSEINRSKHHILSLKDNWDGEGSKGFSEKVWRVATDFLSNLFFDFYSQYKITLEIPTILPVEDLSIDIHWKLAKMELTINFSEEFLNCPSFYGKDNKGNEIQGIIEIDKIFQILFPWLKNFY
ncbi:MAG: hypothetical protein ACFFDH_21060 [Promethearchaeota archaeon]